MSEIFELPKRRIRVQYFPHSNPPRWEAYYEPPGAKTCLYWASSLTEMMGLLDKYFTGKSDVKVQRVQPHLTKFIRRTSDGIAW